MDKNFLTIKDRILYFIEKEGVKKLDFFKRTGISASNFKGEGLKSEIGGNKIVKILTIFPNLSADWLLLGNEPMFRDRKNEEIPVSNKRADGIPLVSFDVFGRVCCNESDSEIISEHDTYMVPVFDGADFLMQVKGSSMYPKFNGGDIVACKKVPLNDLFFQWNKVYVLNTTQGPIIKRVVKGKDENYIQAISDDPRYEPFELRKDQLKAVAIVIGAIRLE